MRPDHEISSDVEKNMDAGRRGGDARTIALNSVLQIELLMDIRNLLDPSFGDADEEKIPPLKISAVVDEPEPTEREKELLEALREYGTHGTGCEWWTVARRQADTCSCGLTQILEGG